MASQIKNQNLLTTEIRFNTPFFLLLLIFQIFALIIYLQYDLFYSLPIFLVLLFLLFFILGENRLKILIIFTIFFASILTGPTSRKPTILRLEEIPFFFSLFLTFLAFKRKEKYHLRTKTDYLLLSFLLLATFSFFYGIFSGNPLFRTLEDFVVIFYYAFYFLVLIYFQDEKWQKILIISIIVVSLLVSLEYLIPFLLTFQIKRYATDQQHLFNLVYPLLFSYIILGDETKYKILAFLSLIPVTLAVIISFTRALWITIPFSIFVILIIYLFSYKKPKSRRTIFLLLGSIILIIAITYFLIRKENLRKFIKIRAQTFAQLTEDISILERIYAGQYLLKEFKKSPILGVGLGTVYPAPITKKGIKHFSWMDSLYLNLLWKMGLIGLIIFLLIYYFFFKNVVKIFKSPKNNFQKWVSLGVLSAFISLIIISIESAVLLIYRFNFVWAALLAIFNLWASKTSEEKV